jgi:hypothetical protein
MIVITYKFNAVKLEDIELKENKIINNVAKINLNKFIKQKRKLSLFYITDTFIYLKD